MPAVEVPLNVLEERLRPLQVTRLRRLAGGASSLTYAGVVPSGEKVVVKVAPAGVPPLLNRDVLRQARALRALSGTAVPVPEVLWQDGGEPPEVPPLFVTSFVDGTSLEPLFDMHGDVDGVEAVDVVAARMRAAARVMAELHRLDPATIGLGDEAVVGLEDEVARWCRLLETVDPNLAPGWEAVSSELAETAPLTAASSLIHGDLRLGNMLAVGADIRAIIDWEIWVVGDPRVDLGWFLVNAHPATYGRPTPYVGKMPSPEDLAAIYGDAPDLSWFLALACFKSAATWALIVKHNRRRSHPELDLEAMAAVLPALLGRARDLIRGGGSL